MKYFHALLTNNNHLINYSEPLIKLLTVCEIANSINFIERSQNLEQKGFFNRKNGIVS